jgi:hypothetical protein
MNFVHLLQSIEGAIYEIMAWAMLFPKTLIKAMFKPFWGSAYVNSEWEKEKEEQRFDDYLSPGLLWLIVGVLQVFLSDPIKSAAVYVDGIPFLMKLLEPLSKLEGESRLGTQMLFLMIYPFFYLVWIEWLNKTPLQKSTLKRNFQIQCYAQAPAQFLGMIIPLGFVFIWFYELFVFKTEFQTSWKRAMWYALVPQLLMVVAFVAFFFLTGIAEGIMGG